MRYSNFFEWYKEEHEKWEKEHPDDLYDCGIDDATFRYFIMHYFYDGNTSMNDYNTLVTIFKKHSKRYRREVFWKKWFNKTYKPRFKKDSSEEYLFNLTLPFTDMFNGDVYISDAAFVDYCIAYLDGEELSVDPVGRVQYDLDALILILRKHSRQFRIEEFLYKLYKK